MVTMGRSAALAAVLVLVSSCNGAPSAVGKGAAAPVSEGTAGAGRRELRACVAACRRSHASESEELDQCARRCLRIQAADGARAGRDDGVPWGILFAVTAGALLTVLTSLF